MLDWSNIFSEALGQFKPFVDNFLFPMIGIILGIILVKDIVKLVMNYRRGDDIDYMPIILLTIALAILVVLRASGAMWTILAPGTGS